MSGSDFGGNWAGIDVHGIMSRLDASQLAAAPGRTSQVPDEDPYEGFFHHPDPDSYARPIPIQPTGDVHGDDRGLPVPIVFASDDENRETAITPSLPDPKRGFGRRTPIDTAAPHMLPRQPSAVGRLTAATRVKLLDSLKGWHTRYSRYLLDPTETRPMKITPYALIGAHATALLVDTGNTPVASTLDRFLSEGSTMTFSGGALAATILFTMAEVRNYPDEKLESPIARRVAAAAIRNTLHPITAHRKRTENRTYRKEAKTSHKATLI